jgi:NAD(P) transhydrogenase subunit alpha
MIIGIPKESFPGERRVALVPAVLPSLAKAGCEALVEAGAGAAAFWPDAAYVEKGGRIAASRAELFASAEAVFQVLAHGANDRTGRADLPLLRRGQALIGCLRPLASPETVLRSPPAPLFCRRFMPRITCAQSMDALLHGYRGGLQPSCSPPISPGCSYARDGRGTVTPARVLIGRGVAGLQAIATAGGWGRGVGLRRPAGDADEVRSLGGRLELPLEAADAEDVGGYAKGQDESFYRRQRELLARVVAETDVVITTASVPGKKAPILITADMVAGMAPGSVIVDLAAERGGNCELTRAYETVVEHGVTIIGAVNLAGSVPYHASQMYARNLAAFFLHLVKSGSLQDSLDDEITRATLLTREGEVVHPAREALGLPPLLAPPRRGRAEHGEIERRGGRSDAVQPEGAVLSFCWPLRGL